jgi:vacuolar protein sorting-associated protein 13A/C
MLEGILEKILVSYFGNYLSGLNKSNIHLGVFSGNLIIENVTIQ